MPIDLRLALNAISDITNNRPLPLREFDQIYMKAGDMVVHAEYLARRFDKKRLVFVGDGDSVGLSLAHLKGQGILEYGPSTITVLDFDQRVVNSIARFAADYECEDISARLYNVIDALPEDLLGAFDGFHINPPWGQHNNGESVVVFLERAAQCISVGGAGMVVIADDATLPWTNDVLRRTQQAALDFGLIIDQMIPARHSYHLDDAPDLKSCAMGLRVVRESNIENARLTGDRLENFYGRSQRMRVHYVEEIPSVSRGGADDRTYRLIPVEEQG